MNINKPYDSLSVASYLLAIAHSKGVILNVTQTQKLLYMAYGTYLCKTGKRLTDESPKAWPFGPVFPTTRKEIDYSKIMTFQDVKDTRVLNDTDLETIVDILVDKYSKYSATQLSEWSHMKGSPWERTCKQEGFQWNTTIPDLYIKEYFSTYGI